MVRVEWLASSFLAAAMCRRGGAVSMQVKALLHAC